MELNDSKMSINRISREELKEKLDRGDKFKLVNALGGLMLNIYLVLLTSATYMTQRKCSMSMMILLFIVPIQCVL